MWWCSFAQSVRVMMAVAIFLSYGLQFYVPINIVGPWFNSLFRSESQRLSDAALRITLVAFTCKFAIFSSQNFKKYKKYFTSRTSRNDTESGSNNFLGWSCKQQHISIDISAADWNYYILAQRIRTKLLGAVEGHFDYGFWYIGFHLWNVYEHSTNYWSWYLKRT